MLAAKVRFDRERAPVVELVEQCLARGARLQAERVAAEIGLFACAVRRDQEFRAERGKRIGAVARARDEFRGGGWRLHRVSAVSATAGSARSLSRSRSSIARWWRRAS